MPGSNLNQVPALPEWQRSAHSLFSGPACGRWCGLLCACFLQMGAFWR